MRVLAGTDPASVLSLMNCLAHAVSVVLCVEVRNVVSYAGPIHETTPGDVLLIASYFRTILLRL